MLLTDRQFDAILKQYLQQTPVDEAQKQQYEAAYKKALKDAIEFIEQHITEDRLSLAAMADALPGALPGALPDYVDNFLKASISKPKDPNPPRFHPEAAWAAKTTYLDPNLPVLNSIHIYEIQTI